MRVLLSPDAGVLPGIRACAEGLAGADGGRVVELARVGVKNLRRRLSAAEVHALRKALLGLGPGHDLAPRDSEDVMVGYLCVGTRPSAEAATARVGRSEAECVPAGYSMITVTDHANLTWESPLTGPNDESLGPRFPVTAGLYLPERVTAALAGPGAALEAGVVAGVRDERRLSPFEAGVVAGGGFAAVAAELAPVTVVAAHLGFHVAAAVLVAAPPA